jgi:hypothetical protein
MGNSKNSPIQHFFQKRQDFFLEPLEVFMFFGTKKGGSGLLYRKIILPKKFTERLLTETPFEQMVFDHNSVNIKYF